MKLFVVRHGETDYNKNKKIQGRINIPLNENGKNQAINLRNKLKNEHIDLIISSPLDRAFLTATIISDGEIPIVKDNRIMERGLGNLEGVYSKNYDRYKYGDLWLNTNEENVEPIKDLYKRVGKFLKDLKKYDKNTILIVTHGGVMGSIYYHFNKIPDDKNIAIEIPDNCEIFEYNL